MNIYLKQKINYINKLKNSLEQQKDQLENLKIEQLEGFEIIQSKLYSNESLVSELNAFLHLHSAIKYSLSVDHKIDGYNGILNDLKKYMLNITLSSFMKENKSVDRFKECYKHNDIKIREHQNYLYIKDKYEDLMSKFEKRLNYISNMKNVSDDEIDKLYNETE